MASRSFWLLSWLSLLFTSTSSGEVHYHHFVVEATPVKRLCKWHKLITVNGQLPGPTIEVRNGDSLVVKVVNRAKYNVTIHWHGVRQLRTAWADGPEYITQCPIKPGGNYTYRFTISGQEGTLWWHAHSSWLRATVYGALIIYPKNSSQYPFPMPTRDAHVLLGSFRLSRPLEQSRTVELPKTGIGDLALPAQSKGHTHKKAHGRMTLKLDISGATNAQTRYLRTLRVLSRPSSDGRKSLYTWRVEWRLGQVMETQFSRLLQKCRSNTSDVVLHVWSPGGQVSWKLQYKGGRANARRRINVLYLPSCCVISTSLRGPPSCYSVLHFPKY